MVALLSPGGGVCEFVRDTGSHLAKPLLLPSPGIALQDALSPKRSGVPLRLRQGWRFRSFRDLPERRKQGR